MKKIVLLLFLIFFLAGCGQEEIKEGQVYIVTEDYAYEEESGDLFNIEGRIPFEKYVDQSFLDEGDSERILLTVAPNGEEMYWMEREETEEPSPVIKGKTGELVRIIKEDIASGGEKVIVKEIPFVSQVLWNAEGNIVAFGGGGRLSLYDTENRTKIMEEKLAEDTIIYFFWDPTDEDKLYSEQANLPNGSIYYLSSQRKVEAYETREETYYKGKLDSNYYYGTKWDFIDGEIKTVILDNRGEIIKVLTSGRFRDAYQRSLVVVEEGGFGLHYIKDMNNPEEVITLTEEYIYDVKFVTEGKIAYITKTEDVEENAFYLNIVNRDGRRLKKVKVHGDRIAVLPDGKTGYISGPQWQGIDFLQAKLMEDDPVVEDDPVEAQYKEFEAIYTTIRGAVVTLYDYKLKGEVNRDHLGKYFKNTSSPEQWAYFDMEEMFNEKVDHRGVEEYILSIDLKYYAMQEDQLSIKIGVGTKTPYGRNVMMDYALELIKSEDRWYVTGFSTFPFSLERKELKTALEEILIELQTGVLFQGELKDKEINVGQIQFWISSISQLASNVEAANTAKVVLKVNTEDKEEVYTLVLEKIHGNYWEPTKLSQEAFKNNNSYF